MTTNQKAEKTKNFSNEHTNPKDLLTRLEHFLTLKDYQHLGYTLTSVCKVLKTALLTQIEFPEYTEHNLWDLYNLINLAQSLIPEEEWELLDKLNA